MYFLIYNPRIRERKNMSYGKGRWQVRKWVGIYPRKLSLWNTDMSEVIMTICKEEMSENGLIDAGYEKVDIRVIDAIRESHWFLLKAKEKVAAMDWRNEKRVRFINDELDYQSKYVAKRVWRDWREPTVNLDGNCYRWSK